jgi:hypothetical protein
LKFFTEKKKGTAGEAQQKEEVGASLVLQSLKGAIKLLFPRDLYLIRKNRIKHP